MSEDNAKMPAGEPEEEMSVELELEDGTLVNCAVITILDVAEKSYIVLLRWMKADRMRTERFGSTDIRKTKRILTKNRSCVILRTMMSMKW